MLSLPDLQPAIEAALRDQVLSMTGTGSGPWRVTLSDGSPLALLARVVDGWLELTTELPVLQHPLPKAWWLLLSLNARVGGAACLLGQSDARLRLRGEIRADVAIDDRVASLCEDLRAAHDIVCTSDTFSLGPLLGDEPYESMELSSSGLAELCAEAGWTAAPLDASKGVRVALVDGPSTLHANMGLDRCGHLRTVVPLVGSPILSAVSREAVAWLLLRLPSAVHGVKGLALGRGDDAVPAIAATSERGMLTVHSVECALAALTVACRLVGREAQALTDETLARQYLSLQRLKTPGPVQPNDDTDSQPQEMPCLQLP